MPRVLSRSPSKPGVCPPPALPGSCCVPSLKAGCVLVQAQGPHTMGAGQERGWLRATSHPNLDVSLPVGFRICKEFTSKNELLGEGFSV